MKKAVGLALLVIVIAGLFLSVRKSLATVSYHYRYQILTQGKSYPANTNLEIKLYINAEGEQVNSAATTVTYNTTNLQLAEVKKWNLFELNVDTSEGGVIKIDGTSTTQFSGEAPLAYLYFTTKTAITDLTQVLSVQSGTTGITPLPTGSNPTVAEPSPTVIVSTLTPTTAPTSIQPTAGPTSAIQIPSCPNIEGDGPFTLVIIPDSYTDLAEFEADAKTTVGHIKGNNLDPAGLKKFTFRYSTDLSKDYRVTVNQRDVNFDVNLAKSTQQACAGNGLLVLSKKYPTREASMGIGGFSVMYSGYAVVLKHSLFVAMHELSHALAGVFDEYSFGTQANSSPVSYNCAGSNRERCQEWAEKFAGDPKVGCFQTCGYTNWYRSTQWSAMNNNPAEMNYFNPPSVEMWNSFFAKY